MSDVSSIVIRIIGFGLASGVLVGLAVWNKKDSSAQLRAVLKILPLYPLLWMILVDAGCCLYTKNAAYYALRVYGHIDWDTSRIVLWHRVWEWAPWFVGAFSVAWLILLVALALAKRRRATQETAGQDAGS